MRNVLCAVVFVLLAFGSPAQAGNKDFSAQFNNCEEFVGIGLVSAPRARALVPSQYTLAGDATHALLVVRVVNCDEASVDGKKAGAARTAQIGVMLNVPGSDADIDNYTLWFATNSGNLNGKMQAAGVKTSNTQQLSYTWQSNGGQSGPLPIDVSAASFPTLSLRGDAQAANYPPQSFVANWYATGKQGQLLMHTSFPVLRFGDAALVLSTPAGSELAQLIGGTSLSFGELNSHNAWPAAEMQATVR
jgi:hypothetical protein